MTPAWVLKVGQAGRASVDIYCLKHLILAPRELPVVVWERSHLLSVKVGGQKKVTEKACPDDPVRAGWLFRKEKGSLVTNNLPFPGDSRQGIEKALVVNIMKRLVHSVVVSCRKYTNKARKESLRLRPPTPFSSRLPRKQVPRCLLSLPSPPP